jgi:hypothetical protein
MQSHTEHQFRGLPLSDLLSTLYHFWSPHLEDVVEIVRWRINFPFILFLFSSLLHQPFPTIFSCPTRARRELSITCAPTMQTRFDQASSKGAESSQGGSTSAITASVSIEEVQGCSALGGRKMIEKSHGRYINACRHFLLLCVAKNETSVDIMCRRFCCNFLRKSRL